MCVYSTILSKLSYISTSIKKKELSTCCIFALNASRDLILIAKTEESPSDVPGQFRNCVSCGKYLKDNKHNSLQLVREYTRIFVLGHHVSVPQSWRCSSSFRNRQLSTDKYIQAYFRAKWNYCLFILLEHLSFLVNVCW